MCVEEIELYLIRVLTGDPSSYDVPSWARHALRSLKVNDGVTPWRLSIKQADVLNSIKGNAHRNLPEMKRLVEGLQLWLLVSLAGELLTFLMYNCSSW